MAQDTFLKTETMGTILYTKVQGDLTELFADVASVESDITDIQTEIENARDGEANLLAQVDALQASIAALAAGSGVTVSGDDTTVGTLSDKITSADGSITLTITDPAGNEGYDLSVSSTVTASPITSEARTENAQLAAADTKKLINITSGTFTQTFVAAATLGAGWYVWIKNSGSGTITLNPDGTETIDGEETITMSPGDTRLISCTGTLFYSVLVPTQTSVAITGGTITGITNLEATGGTITGITDLAVADGGTGASTAAAARTNLGVEEMTYVARTSNTILVAANKGNLIDATSGTWEQTFTAAATLGNGWFCYIRNSGTGLITLNPNGTETIDGLTTFVMYPGESRFISCTGTAFVSFVLTPFYYAFTASGTFTRPPGYSGFRVMAWGGGGGGRRDTTGGDCFGGGGGAGIDLVIPSNLIADSESMTVGAGGSGKGTTNNGNYGGDTVLFGNSTFGGSSGLTVYGGRGGTSSAGIGGNSLLSSTVSNHDVLYPNTSGTFWGGASATSVVRIAVFGSGSGGAVISGVLKERSYSLFGGDGGAASNVDATDGEDGSIPGGGGGGCAETSGTTCYSGFGARGEARIWGVI